MSGEFIICSKESPFKATGNPAPDIIHLNAVRVEKPEGPAMECPNCAVVYHCASMTPPK